MKIAIDIDDTLTKVDRVSYAQQYITEHNLNYQLRDATAHALSEIFDWSYDDVHAFILDGGAQIFTNAPAREGASEVIQGWRAAGHDITVLTARSTEWFVDPVALSKTQLAERNIPYDNVVADVWEKGKYCIEHGIEILIEDNFEICRVAQALGVKAIMFLDSHNLEHKDEIEFTASEWSEVAQIVERILGAKE